MSENLIIAVPSKGRLEEKTATLFAEAGLKLKRDGERGYTGEIEGLKQVKIAYLSASEIAARLKDGTVHFGVTGEDLLREQMPDLENCVQLVTPLGFGRADVVVAVPDGWADVRNMTDLADVTREFRKQNNRLMRVATKYNNLTTQFFTENGVYDVQLVPSPGATEGAIANGTAELIVDITSTGTTLKANNLRVLDDGVILKSEANLTASLKADWDTQGIEKASGKILIRMLIYIVKRTVKEISAIRSSNKPPNYSRPISGTAA